MKSGYRFKNGRNKFLFLKVAINDDTKSYLISILSTLSIDVFFYDLETKKWENLATGLPIDLQGDSTQIAHQTK